jgi:hypothetical protein
MFDSLILGWLSGGANVRRLEKTIEVATLATF